MRLRTHSQRTYLLLLLLFTFLFIDVSESISIPPAIGFLDQLTRSKRFSFSSILNGLKSLVNNAHKFGDRVSGISDVIDYLETFGYLNSSSNSNSPDDVFTVNLQFAITQFQKNFNLGKQLDETTYQKLTQPRCGVPDIINGINTMNSNKVNIFKPSWITSEKELTLTYAFHPQNDVTNDVKSLFKGAFKKWSDKTGLKFNEAASFIGSNIKIVFVRIDGKDGIVGGVNMNVGIIYLDSEEDWVLSNEIVGQDGDKDLESVVMHEVGHILGLEHSSVEEAIMYPIVSSETKTELVNYDDLKRISEIYGVTASHHLPPQFPTTYPALRVPPPLMTSSTSSHNLSLCLCLCMSLITVFLPLSWLSGL